MSKPHILIIGAGAWGSSTAVSLLESGKYTVTLLDRGTELPTADAASMDMNKIVRFDYRTPQYADLAFKALERWREPEWAGMYNESGTVVVAETGDKKYDLDGTIAIVSERCPDIKTHSTRKEVESALDPMGKGVAGDMTGRRAYSNPWGGWVDAAKATKHLIDKTEEHPDGTVIRGAEASSFIFGEDGDIKGVKCLDGRGFEGDKVIVASGAWTENLMGELLPSGLLTSVGIVVAAFKLSEEEYERYKDIPVIMGWDGTGFYSMPPTPDTKMLKFGLAEHKHGYTTESGIPRTTLSPGAADWHKEHNTSWLPDQSFATMREVTERFFPEFTIRPFDFTRMCPIPDTCDGDFVLDYISKHPSLLVASGGSDHSYKMMPIIGDLVRERMEGTLDPSLAKLWAIRSGRTESILAPRSNVEDITFAGAKQVQVDTGEGTAVSA